MTCESGLSGRRGRWHQKLSRFNLTVVCIRGVENGVADALSRYAYPASQAFLDVSWHGSAEDDREMRELLTIERREEQASGVIPAPSPMPVGLQLPVRVVQTRSPAGESPRQLPRLASPAEAPVSVPLLPVVEGPVPSSPLLPVRGVRVPLASVSDGAGRKACFS